MNRRWASNHKLMLDYVLVDMYLVGVINYFRGNLRLRFFLHLLNAVLTGTSNPSASVGPLAD